MATIDDVAKRAGVSKSSVSRVLNENYEYMSEEMKQKIQQAIQELNYKPNSVAQSLKKKETRIIGIVLADLSPFWTDVLKGVQDECMRNGYGIMFSDSAMSPENEEENISRLQNKQVDGLIINTVNPHSRIFDELKSEKYPFVFINSTPDVIKEDTVVANNTAGTIEAMEYLIGLGHRRIAIFLYPVENILVRTERLEAYKACLEKNGIPIDESLIKICRPEKGNGVEITRDLLNRPDQPTAFLTTNIYLTLEVLKGVRQAGLVIPMDISVVGYDDFEWSPLLDPPLTTVAVPAFEMGVKTAELLIKKIQRKRQKPPQRIEVMPKLIIRESAGRVRRSAAALGLGDENLDTQRKSLDIS